MKGKELAELAMRYPDLDFEFAFIDTDNGQFTSRRFNISTHLDIDSNDKIVWLSGKER